MSYKGSIPLGLGILCLLNLICLKIKKVGISPEKAINILKTIYSLTITTPYSNTKHTQLLNKTQEQDNLLKLFDIH